MEIRHAKLEDARQIAQLIERSASPFRMQDFDEAGWNRFVASNGEAGIAVKLIEARRMTLLAVDTDELRGLISVTGGNKIDLLFVCPRHMRKGIASGLWHAILALPEVTSRPTDWWVRSSSAGVPFYRQLGFTAAGEGHSADGISYTFMQLAPGKPAAG